MNNWTIENAQLGKEFETICICLKNDWDIPDGRVYKGQIYTCRWFENSAYCDVIQNDKHIGIFEIANFKPLAEWRNEQIDKILNDE
jgi:hypothetical protein